MAFSFPFVSINGDSCELIFLFIFFFSWHSYEKNYKRLLDNMVKNDLVLKGHVDRIELLIFPSNRLPEISQRKAFFFRKKVC